MTLENPGGVRFSGPLRIRKQELDRTGSSAADTTVIDSSGTATFTGRINFSVDGNEGARVTASAGGTAKPAFLCYSTVTDVTANQSAGAAKVIATMPQFAQIQSIVFDITTTWEASANPAFKVGSSGDATGIGVLAVSAASNDFSARNVRPVSARAFQGGIAGDKNLTKPWHITGYVSAVGTQPDAGAGMVTVTFAVMNSGAFVI